MNNTCVICGAEIPEGRMVCPKCEAECEAVAFERVMGRKVEAPDTASKTVEKWLSESAEYHSTTHTSEDVQRLTEALREAKGLLAKALEVIKARSSCSLPCIYCAYDGSEDCPREAVFKWKYEDRVKEVLKSNE